MKLTMAILVTVISLSTPAQAQPLSAAETIFTRYQVLERAYDSAVADLYCDTALIRNIRIYPNGRQRTLELSASKYKALIRSGMPLARVMGDYSTYSEVAYAAEEGNVRITATRYGALKQYSSPITLLIGACDGGDWGILEELSYSRP